MKTQREDILKDIVRKSYEARSNALHEAKKDDRDQFSPPPPPPPTAAPSPSAIGGKGASGGKAGSGSRAGGAVSKGSAKKAKVFQLQETFADVTIGELYYACPQDFPGLLKEGGGRAYGPSILTVPVYRRFKTKEEADDAEAAIPALVKPVAVKFEAEALPSGFEVNAEGDFVKDKALEFAPVPAYRDEDVEPVGTPENSTLDCGKQNQNLYRKDGANTVVLVRQFNEIVDERKKA
tara:strand:- start:29 stop:736 length:708 start_codon:yes stop_codon:yes gene_type:complete